MHEPEPLVNTPTVRDMVKLDSVAFITKEPMPQIEGVNVAFEPDFAGIGIHVVVRS